MIQHWRCNTFLQWLGQLVEVLAEDYGSITLATTLRPLCVTLLSAARLRPFVDRCKVPACPIHRTPIFDRVQLSRVEFVHSKSFIHRDIKPGALQHS